MWHICQPYIALLGAKADQPQAYTEKELEICIYQQQCNRN
nr:MAG TPA: hypothetical protein [Caudoviricetes sp.]